MKSDDPFQVRDWVEVRPVAEVLATPDDQASTDALLFMPEMVRFCGRRFQVAEPVQAGRASRRDPVARRLADTVNLETYCDGSGHDGCEGRCLMVWKSAWLRAADGPAADQPPPPAEETAGIERLAAAARLPAQAGTTVRYRCQFTSPDQDAAASSRAAMLQNLAAMTARRMVLRGLGRHRSAGTSEAPSSPTRSADTYRNDLQAGSRNDLASAATFTGSINLQPGEMVQVRPADEIKAVLAANCQKNGLGFETEMLQCSGGTYCVVGHVRRLIDGRTAEMIQLPDDCIILEESRRTQIDVNARRFGRLSPYFYWDRAWLRPAGNADLKDWHAAPACFPMQPIRIVQRFDVAVSYDPSVVAGVWEALEPEGTVFQTRAWLLPLYRIVAPKFHMAPLFVTVSDRSSGRPMMLLPLCIGRKWGLTVIEFADFGITDYNGPLVSPALNLNAAETQDLWDDICHALPPADIVLLDKVPELASGRPVPLAQLRWVRRMDMRAWAVALPQTRDEYDRIILKPKDRKEQRRKRRNLVECLGELTLVHAGTESERRTFFEALKKQREARCKEAGYHDLLLDPTFLRFYEAVAYGELGDVVSLSALKARDRIVATLFALTHNNNYLLVAHCFEPCAEGLSPGIVAIDEMVTHLIRSGTRNFDFTIGNEGYKRQFGVTASILCNGTYPLSAKGRLFVQAEETKRHVKSTLSPQLNAYRRLVQEQWERVARKDWGLARLLRRNDRDSQQAMATAPREQRSAPQTAEPVHSPG